MSLPDTALWYYGESKVSIGLTQGGVGQEDG